MQFIKTKKFLLFSFFSRVGGGFVCFKNETECVDEGGENALCPKLGQEAKGVN